MLRISFLLKLPSKLFHINLLANMCVRMYRWFFLLLISSSSSYLLFRLFGTQYFGVIQLCKHKHDGELNKSLQHIRTIIPCTARALPLSSNSELYTQATHKRTWQTFVVRLSDTAGNNTRNSREYSPETCVGCAGRGWLKAISMETWDVRYLYDTW